MKIVLHVVIAIVASGFTVAMYVVWATATDMAHAEKDPVVPISEVLAEAKAGHVDDMKVRGTRYELHVRGRSKVAYGPKTTAAELAPLAGAAKLDVQ